MHDYPQTAKFLTADEKTEVTARLKLDRSSLADEYDIKYLWHALQDWKIWVHMLITIGNYTPLYSISLFMPTIVRGKLNSTYNSRTRPVKAYQDFHTSSVPMLTHLIYTGLGYTNETAQLMTVPPYVVACAFCITGGYLADKYKTRGIFMISFFVTALVGFTMLIASTNSGVKYAGIFFVAIGIYSNVPQGVACKCHILL